MSALVTSGGRVKVNVNSSALCCHVYDGSALSVGRNKDVVLLNNGNKACIVCTTDN